MRFTAGIMRGIEHGVLGYGTNIMSAVQDLLVRLDDIGTDEETDALLSSLGGLRLVILHEAWENGLITVTDEELLEDVQQAAQLFAPTLRLVDDPVEA